MNAAKDYPTLAARSLGDGRHPVGILAHNLSPAGKLRAILVEAVWRLLAWQPGWKSALKYRARLTEGAAIKKKTVVALARQLAIDLWRWRTGRATLAELGWIAA
jgi:hypothetical protein